MMGHYPDPTIRRKFAEFFGLNIMHYWNPIMPFCQFDVIKFDDWLQTPDGISTRDYITQKYSLEASDFVAGLLLS